MNKEDFLLTFLVSFCCGVFRAKTDLHNKYMIINFVFDSLFEQDHLLNLFILGVYAKR